METLPHHVLKFARFTMRTSVTMPSKIKTNALIIPDYVVIDLGGQTKVTKCYFTNINFYSPRDTSKNMCIVSEVSRVITCQKKLYLC